MAVVSAITTLELSVLGSTRRWTATAATQDTAAGGSVVVTITVATTGATPPSVPDNLEISFRADNTATIVKTVVLTTGVSSQTASFTFTDTGSSGGGAVNRCGTIRMRLFANRTSGSPTERYTVNSDDTSGEVLPTSGTITIRNQGWIRGTTTLTEAISNLSLGGGKTLPAKYAESLFVRLTMGAATYLANAISVALSNTSPALSGNTNSTTSATRDVTFTTAVTNRFPAASTVTQVVATPPNAALTGVAAFTFTSTTDDSITVDPRLTCTHLLQIDDNSFGTPPMSKNSLSGQRLGSSIGFMTTNLRDARGTKIGDDITGGVNGINCNIHFQDNNALATAITRDATTALQDGENGWMTGFLQWTSALPAGIWNKTVTVNTPSNITGAGYLVNNTISYTLVSANPNIVLLAGAGNANVSLTGRHFSPGNDLIIGAALVNIELFKYAITVDSGSVMCSIVRLNTATGKGQYLRSSDLTFVDIGTGTFDKYLMTVSPTDSKVFTKTFTAAQTANWGTLDIGIICECTSNGSPYFSRSVVDVVSNKNPHDRNSLDPTGLFK